MGSSSCASMYNKCKAPSPKWFSTATTRARESRTRNRRVQIDSSTSDRSVEARQPRHREEPTSGRGKAKRVMAALTTESDTGPDSLGETDPDKRPPMQVSPRVFHAPDPPGIAPPPPPPGSHDPGAHVELIRLATLRRYNRSSERPCPTQTTFQTGTRTPLLRRSPLK